ncbi:Site-specific recombinase XerD [Draconibacterium orientale]|uniref:Site-specific recombinase XerD n=1 Tax=Draconibacterium orientale TaxID=1168034 RepID=X5DNE4_9BACT|nr:site-specific integrase [Draconibacterium orientale]AHW62147.1 hypothetical protein FH5T_16145 [Draconibacterium orientale]SET79170.1 Site-specific recombinase XerD [Draconibacterium orientale]
MASIKVILYTHKTLKDGSHPILIQVLKDRKRKTISLGHSATKKQWNTNQQLPNSKHPNQSLLTARIKRVKTSVNDIILKLENKEKPFSVDDIIKQFRNNGTDETFETYTDALIETLKTQGKLGNARVYTYTKNAFMAYRNEMDIKLSEIDIKIVQGFESYLTVKGNKLNSVSLHLRTLRAIINRAIKEGLIEESAYPFKKISIKTQKTRKRAVNKDVIKMVEELDVSKEDNLQLYKDLFMFSFYNRGMNFVDMAYLKVKNIESGRINYTRQKTGQQFSIKITDKAQAIIDRYCKLEDKESYVFPIIYRKDKEYLDYRNAMRLMNKKLKKISELLKLDVSLTTYVSRHSWATIAKRSGIATAVISEGLGHESEETTQVYLDSFENDVLDDANELIIS